jgi:hypothetical protein
MNGMPRLKLINGNTHYYTYMQRKKPNTTPPMPLGGESVTQPYRARFLLNASFDDRVARIVDSTLARASPRSKGARGEEESAGGIGRVKQSRQSQSNGRRVVRPSTADRSTRRYADKTGSTQGTKKREETRTSADSKEIQSLLEATKRQTEKLSVRLQDC